MSYRIVVADQDPRSRETVKRFLSEDNKLIDVSSANELKQAIKQEKPDLILLNTMLADSQGWPAVQKVVKGIKNSRDYKDIPVIVMADDPSINYSEAQSAGADGYLSKPINGADLRNTVESLLGISGPNAGDEDDEIMIDFADDDSGDMTEELLAMSNVALDTEEPSTDVGDTVEIDTGTLVAELDHSGEMGMEETYEDTVRLNLEDMGLDDDGDDGGAFEPTIELIADVPTEFGDAPASDSGDLIDLELDTDEELPDFSSSIKEFSEPAPAGKDSITVEMDVDDLALDLDSDTPVNGLHETDIGEIENDTEINSILDVQEPSKVLTSKDLMLDDESLIKDTASIEASDQEVDVIDLEESTEIRDMEFEELDSIGVDEPILELDSDETIPLESLDMEGLEGVGLSDLDLAEEGAGIEFETAVESLPDESEEELILEETGQEEITTQEFLGEELPTEEFPTERFPVETTKDLGLNQEISLELDEGGLELGADDVVFDQASLDSVLGEADLAELIEDGPSLEVTEEIAFDEIPIDQGVQDAEPVKESSVIGDAMAAAAVVGGAAIGAQVLSNVLSSGTRPDQAPSMSVTPEPITSQAFASESSPPKLDSAIPEGEKQPQIIMNPEEIKSVVAATIKELLPNKDDIVQSIVQSLSEKLPTTEEISTRIDERIKEMLPSPDALKLQVHENIVQMMPPAEAITSEVNKKFDQFIASMPDPHGLGRDFKIKLDMYPTSDEINSRFDAFWDNLPDPKSIQDRFESKLSSYPDPEPLKTKLDEFLSSLPNSEFLYERIDGALANVPGPETILERIEKTLSGYPSGDEVRSRLDSALDLKAVNTRFDELSTVLERIQGSKQLLDKALEVFPGADQIEQIVSTKLDSCINPDIVQNAVEKSLSDPSQKQLMRDRIEGALNDLSQLHTIIAESINALKALPSADQVAENISAKLPDKNAILERVENKLESFPSPEEFRSRFDTMFGNIDPASEFHNRINSVMETMPSGDEFRSRIDERLRQFPDEGEIKSRLDSAFSQFPTHEQISHRINESLSRLPDRDEIMSRIQAALEGLPSAELIHQKLDQALSPLPSREEMIARIDSMFTNLPSAEHINRRFDEALEALPNKQFFKDQVDTVLSSAISAEMFAEKVDIAMRGMPSPEYVRLRLDNAFAAFPTGDMINEKLNIALQSIPKGEEVTSRLDKAFNFPSPEVITQRIEQMLMTLMPDNAQFQNLVRETIQNKINSIISESDISASMERIVPSKDLMLDTILKALPERERLQQILAVGVTDAIRQSLPERTWLESLSRGLFDDRAKELMPEREAVIEILKAEIRSKLLEMIEQAIRTQLEKITMDAS
jgi:DNA-binding response OmpR family regulator